MYSPDEEEPQATPQKPEPPRPPSPVRIQRPAPTSGDSVIKSINFLTDGGENDLPPKE